jgi:nitrate/nitrite-specific signal transduction histidine kinase
MKKDGERDTDYVRKVQEGNRRYVEKLLKENETLRTLLVKTESEKLAMEEKVLTLEEQVGRHEKERISLRRQMAEIEANNQRFTKEYLQIEHQNANLANLYVTSYRLHATLGRDEVLSVIQEILINLVGSEEVAVFEVDDDGKTLTLASSFGIDQERYQRVALGSGVIGRVAESGEPFFGNGDPEKDDGVTACIALKVDDNVTGVITVFGLLPQKSDLESVDHELFDLLGTHAAVALYSSGLAAKLQDALEVGG